MAPSTTPVSRLTVPSCSDVLSLSALHEVQPHSRRRMGDTGEEARPESLHEPIAGPEREAPLQTGDVQKLRRSDRRLRLLHKITNAVA